MPLHLKKTEMQTFLKQHTEKKKLSTVKLSRVVLVGAQCCSLYLQHVCAVTLTSSKEQRRQPLAIQSEHETR